MRSARGEEREFSISAVKPYQQGSALCNAVLHACQRFKCNSSDSDPLPSSEVFSCIVVDDPYEGDLMSLRRVRSKDFLQEERSN